MFRPIAITAVALTLVAGLSLAEPGVRVVYRDGVPRVQLEGDWSHTRYTVQRASRRDAVYAPVSNEHILCLGDCYVDDADAAPGVTYWYRFDLEKDDGTAAVFGPFAVTISDLQVRWVGVDVAPNPGAGETRLRFFLWGRASLGPVPIRAALFDLQGRVVRRLHDGPLARGATTIVWDGRGDDGRPLRSGVYFLSVQSSLGSTVARVLRAH
ncbi:MAG: hypothetical protein A2W00_02345 [Candidatus Eisenbacteria bacterium RBG_16_71_46]|nr:MAG: hypothetical protein A2W00_02345 [Candidatus Eisenbacteria bacterium RBG_16_71_46]